MCRAKKTTKPPWLQPNAEGEQPGGPCCQRATGRYCYEHDPANYPSRYLKTWTFWLYSLLFLLALLLLAITGPPLMLHQVRLIREFWGL